MDWISNARARKKEREKERKDNSCLDRLLSLGNRGF
jgi:hypothetical protein